MARDAAQATHNGSIAPHPSRRLGVGVLIASLLQVTPMVQQTFERSLRAFHRRTPFRPFTVELVSGNRFQVDHPEALVFRGGVAVFIAADGTPMLFDHESVSRLSGETDEAESR